MSFQQYRLLHSDMEHSCETTSVKLYLLLILPLDPMGLICMAAIHTVVPALGDPRHERPPAVCGHFVNVPTHFKVKLPVISSHLPNADADSHLLVVSTCYNGQCKQMSRFRWSFLPKIAGAHPNLRPTDLSNFRAVVW